MALQRKWIIGLMCGVGVVLAWCLILRPKGIVVHGTLPPGKVKAQIVMLSRYAILLAPDGSLWGWGGGPGSVPYPMKSIPNGRVPGRIGTDLDWQKIAAGQDFLIALKTNRTLWGCGWNTTGALFTSPDPSDTLMQLDQDSVWQDVVAGCAHCVGLKEDGSLWAWGRNESGQLGDGSTSDSRTPRRIGAERSWVKVWASDYASWALDKDGRLWGWGFRVGAQPTEIPSHLRWGPISAGGVRVLSIKADGTLWLVPQYPHVAQANYQTVQLNGNTNWQRVYCGPNYFLAERRDHSWWAYGGNSYAQTGIGKNEWVSELSPLRYRFDPISIGLGETTTVAFMADGGVWSCGVRLGDEFRPWRLAKVKGFVNQLAAHLPWKPTIFKHQPWPIDFEPVKIWTYRPEDTREIATSERSR
jgi:alpha-tubulin suppressor-like RCC1 family protein